MNVGPEFLGFAAGSHVDNSGGPGEYICLPDSPQWARYASRGWPSYLYGVEYSIHSVNDDLFLRGNNNGKSLHNQDAPCVYCKVRGRSMVTTFAAATECPEGWSLEYGGYLMASGSGQNRAGPVCVDEMPEAIFGGGSDINGGLFCFVESKCRPLPCPPYVDGRQLACVVCSQ